MLLLVSVVTLLLCGKHGALNFQFRRNHETILVGSIHDEHLVLVGDYLAHLTIYLVKTHLAIKQFHQLEVVSRGQDRLSLQEVVHALAHIVRVLIVFLHLQLSFGSIEIKFLGTFQLTLCKTMLTGTFHLAYGYRNATQYIVLLATDAQAEGILGAGNEERTVLHRRTHERRIGHLLFLQKATIEHIGD